MPVPGGFLLFLLIKSMYGLMMSTSVKLNSFPRLYKYHRNKIITSLLQKVSANLSHAADSVTARDTINRVQESHAYTRQSVTRTYYAHVSWMHMSFFFSFSPFFLFSFTARFTLSVSLSRAEVYRRLEKYPAHIPRVTVGRRKAREAAYVHPHQLSPYPFFSCEQHNVVAGLRGFSSFTNQHHSTPSLLLSLSTPCNDALGAFKAHVWEHARGE